MDNHFDKPAFRLGRSGLVIVGAVVFRCATASAQVGGNPAVETPSYPIEPTVLSPPPLSEPDLPVSSADAEPAPAVELPTSNAREISPTPRRFHFHLTLDAALSYDDNVTLAPTNKVAATFLRVQGNVELGLGDIEERQANYVLVNYTPSAFFYLDHSQYDSLDHLVHLEGYHRFSRLALTLKEEIQSSENTNIQYVSNAGGFTPGANIDVSARQRLTTYSTQVNASYDLAPKTALTLSGSYFATDYGRSLINSDTIVGGIGIDYAYGPKLTIGLVANVGENLVDPPSPDETFEQLNVRAAYQATGKLTATASGGVQFRQLQSTTEVDPVFEFGLNYTPFDGTSIRAAAARQITNSATVFNEDYVATQFAVGVSQQLFRRLSAGLTAGYENLSYFSVINGASAAREDNYYFIEPTISVKITRFWEAGAYYRRRENNSSFAVFGFEENQFGIHSGVRF